jgi:hypothetical protein
MGPLLIYLSGTVDGAAIAWLVIGFAFVVAMTMALLQPWWCKLRRKIRRRGGE